MTLTPRLADVCDIQSGGTPRRERRDYYGGPIPWAKISDLEQADGLVTATEESLTSEGLQAIGDRLFPTGTILLAMYGSVGKVAVAGMPLTTNQAILGIRIRDETGLDPHYLRRWLESIKAKLVFGARGVTQQNISATIVKDLRIPLPPAAEQRRIAAVLDNADWVRRKRRESLRLLDEFLRSAFLEMFGDPVRNEKGWEVVHGDDVFADLRYGTSEKCSSDSTGGARPVLRIPNVINGEIFWADLKFAKLEDDEAKRLELVPGDLLFVRTNGNPEYIGRCAMFDGSRSALFASYLIRGRVRDDASYRAEFLKSVVSVPSYRVRLVAESRSTAGNYNISTERLKRLPFIRPPLAGQDRFLEIGNGIKKARREMEGSLSEAEHLFDSLAQRAFGEAR